jgi:hypothetical protein
VIEEHRVCPANSVLLMSQFPRLPAGSDGTEIPARTIGRRSADRPGWKNVADGSSQG